MKKVTINSMFQIRKLTFDLSKVLVILTILMFFTADIPAQIFTKVNDAAITGKKTNGFGSGFFDYNNDGLLDIIVNNSGSRTVVFRNNGDGTFKDVNISNLIPSGGNCSGITIGDYDNDGNNDLFYISMDNNGYLIQNNGDSTFSNITGTPMARTSGFIVHCTWADYDNDGFLDLFIPACGNSNFVSGGGIKNYLFHNNGDKSFSRVNTSAPENTAGNNVCANFSDIDNDGDMDLFMTDCQVNNHLYENVNGTFIELTTSDFSNTNTSIACTWGDYDNDGFMDLFVANGLPKEGGSYESYLYHNNGNKTFTKITAGGLSDFRGNAWNGLWADFDNDGDLDLFIGTYSQPDVLYINNGDGTFLKDAEFDMSSKGTSGACFGDFNKDGFLDLFTGNAYGTGHLLYKNNGNNNNWLFVKCIGTASNKSAIGAKVRIKATINGKTYWQVREINSNTGFRGASDLKAHFGLGDAAKIDSLIIEWPAGIKTVLTEVQVNQVLTIEEAIPEKFIKPNFKSDIRNGYSPAKVQFADASIFDKANPITSWSWDFNDDGIEDSKEQNPSFSFVTSDIKDYNVSLTISNGSNTQTIKKNNFIHILPMSMQNIALNMNASSSSANGTNSPQKAFDGSSASIWSSTSSDSQWIQIELDSIYTVGKVVINWGSNYAKQYKVLYSQNGNEWLELLNEVNGDGQKDEFLLNDFKAKYIKFDLTLRAFNKSGYAVSEIEIYRGTLTDVISQNNKPTGFSLKQNYPNPFNPTTSMQYSIGNRQFVTLKVYDVLGKEVATLVNEEKPAGNYNVKFNGSYLSSGVYFYKLQAGNFVETKKLVLMK